MKKNTTSGFLLLLFLVIASCTTRKDEGKQLFLDTSYSFEERAADLVSRFTLEEKQSLLVNNMAAIPRLGIRAYNVWSEALHGIMDMHPATSFPNSVAIGASWDPDLMEREATAISDEARAFYNTYDKGLTYWSPVVEPSRDPRWGRNGESYGEDPFLISEIAGAFVRGMMGNDPKYLKAAPTAKHFSANNSEYNRHNGNSAMDQRDLREFYLYPYKTLIERDQLTGIMTSYNRVNGIPSSLNKYLVDSVVRKTWGLNGYVTGDCGAIRDIFLNHKYLATPEEATGLSLKAGVDTDCGDIFSASAIDALNNGYMYEADIDRALVHMFTIRMRTGEFDPEKMDPYSNITADVIESPEHIALAAEVAEKTPVLLKNALVEKTNKEILPLDATTLNKIAIIGPLADAIELGPYSGNPSESNRVTPLQAIKALLKEKGSETEVVHITGANKATLSNLFMIASFELVKTDGTITKYEAGKYSVASDRIVSLEAGGGFMGMASMNESMISNINDGDWSSYANVDVSDIEKININLNTMRGGGGIIEVRLGSVTGNLLASVNVQATDRFFFGTSTFTADVNKSGITGKQTVFLVYRSLASAPIDEETIDMAASSDVALLFVGTDERTATEESDRFTLNMPGNQINLIKAIAAVNPNTVVIMQTVGMVEIEEFKDLENIPGIIWYGYNGQAQGTGIAKILFGDVNPGGKLNATWYKLLNDIPPFEDYELKGISDNGRTYQYFTKDVSYEFGYGLSYTTFEYSNFKISKTAITPNDKITVSIDVENTGSIDGDEVVQVYVKTPNSDPSLRRPVKRLKGFKRITIEAGKTQTVTINIDCADLWFWDEVNSKITFDPGVYIFEVGASSEDIRGKLEATMSGAYKASLKTVTAECGQIVMKSGSTVQTNVTAAMSDDSFYDLTNATVTYESNRPSVATVDKEGLVTITGVGTATITANVTINGITASGSYPIKVRPDLSLNSITLNGQELSDFNANIHGYSVLLADDQDKAPQVEAKQADASVKLAIDQAKSLPGTARIALTDDITGEEAIYTVAFGFKSESDEFNNTTLGSQWSWVREDDTKWSLTESPGSLQITLQEGDISDTLATAKNILLQDANTDWTMESKLVFSQKPSAFGQQGGLIAYQDDDNYVKLVYDYTLSGYRPAERFELIFESNGFQINGGAINARSIVKENNTVVFKLEKKGISYTAYYSTDGNNFTPLGTVEAELSDVKAGLIAFAGTGEGRRLMFMMPPESTPETGPEIDFNMAFDYFHIENTGIELP